MQVVRIIPARNAFLVRINGVYTRDLDDLTVSCRYKSGFGRIAKEIRARGMYVALSHTIAMSEMIRGRYQKVLAGAVHSWMTKIVLTLPVGERL